jgi:hypothetical protein
MTNSMEEDLLKRLIFLYLVKKFLAVYGTGRFVTGYPELYESHRS